MIGNMIGGGRGEMRTRGDRNNQNRLEGCDTMSHLQWCPYSLYYLNE